MPDKRKVPFRQADVKRAIKGATEGGMSIGRVEIEPDGRITILATVAAEKPESAFDAWKAGRNARSS